MTNPPNIIGKEENSSDCGGSGSESAAPLSRCIRCDKTISHHQTEENIRLSGRDKPIMERKSAKPDLLNFGLDYLVLMLGIKDAEQLSISMIDAIFSFPHNDTNAAEIRNFIWADTNEEMTIHFGANKNDEVAYMFRGEDKLFSIQKIGAKSTMPVSVKEKYKYRISFYGWMFGLARLGEISVEDYLGVFLRDIKANLIVHAVSRADICADLTNVSVSRVDRGIVRLSTRSKKKSRINIDPVTHEPETVYFGEQSHHWKGRIYNKLLEAEKKGKERLMPDYWDYPSVTRVEIELRSRSCKTYGLTLENCLNREHLLMVYKAHLDNKATKWGILSLIENKLKEQGFKALPVSRHKFESHQMPNRKFFKRTFLRTIECAKRFNVDFKTLLGWMKEIHYQPSSDKNNEK